LSNRPRAMAPPRSSAWPVPAGSWGLGSSGTQRPHRRRIDLKMIEGCLHVRTDQWNAKWIPRFLIFIALYEYACRCSALLVPTCCALDV
jgi:hypothetical protein